MNRRISRAHVLAGLFAPQWRIPSALVLSILLHFSSGVSAAGSTSREITVHFDQAKGPVNPRIGFLGGLRDSFPDTLIQPLNPSLWRIGHQFRGRITGGLTAAIDRVESFGAKYKLVMSDLIPSQPTDWARYEADVKKLVAQVGPRARIIIWEPVNEPDISHKPIEKYYELYAHAFKALREAEPSAAICGPGFAFPSLEKYRPFLDYCREHDLECNYLAWHYTGWDPNYPEKAHWDLGGLRELAAAYPRQRVREIHCDEWGAGPNKPGRLEPGRALIWFYFLEDVYQVDRACRANWGKEDDYLGGVVDPRGHPFPVYHAYRFYGQTKDQTRVAVTGNNKELACLASRGANSYEILLGSVIGGANTMLTLNLQGLHTTDLNFQAYLIPNRNLDAPLSETEIPEASNVSFDAKQSPPRLTVRNLEENQAYRILLSQDRY